VEPVGPGASRCDKHQCI